MLFYEKSRHILFEFLHKRKMLLDILFTKYGWLITSVPQILHSPFRWKLWFDGLSSLDITNFRMNVTGIEQSKYMIEDEFDNYDPWSEEHECLIDIHTRLVDFLFRLTALQPARCVNKLSLEVLVYCNTRLIDDIRVIT